MTQVIKLKRTELPNTPPADLSLQPGELAAELAAPQKLWVGVPTTVDATGKKLLVDTGVVSELPIAPGTPQQYWRGDKTWQPMSPQPTMSGDVIHTAEGAHFFSFGAPIGALGDIRFLMASNVLGLPFDPMYSMGAVPRAYVERAASDQHWHMVHVFLGMDGENGNNLFFDAKGHSCEVMGAGVSLDSTLKKRGQSSAKFVGTGSIRIVGGVSSELDAGTQAVAVPLMQPGTEDYTLEAYVYSVDWTVSGSAVVWDFRWPTTAELFSYYSIEAGIIAAYVNGVLHAGITALTPNIWHHVAWQRKGTDLSLWVDGTQELLVPGIDTKNYLADAMHIGGAYDGTQGANGVWIDEAKYTRGVARYAPPTPAQAPQEDPSHWDWNAGVEQEITVAVNALIGGPSNAEPGTSRTLLIKGVNTLPRTVRFDERFFGKMPPLTDVTDTVNYRVDVDCSGAVIATATKV